MKKLAIILSAGLLLTSCSRPTYTIVKSIQRDTIPVLDMNGQDAGFEVREKTITEKHKCDKTFPFAAGVFTGVVTVLFLLVSSK